MAVRRLKPEQPAEEQQRVFAPIAGQGQWFRFSSYEIVSSPRGIPSHIRPASGAEISYYRPFDRYPKILRDYLELAHGLNDPEGPMDDVTFRERTNRNARRILAFVYEYGLLGILWQCAPQILEGERVFLPQSQWAVSLPRTAHECASGLMDSQRFLSLFLIERRFQTGNVVFRKSHLKEYGELIMCMVRDARDLLQVHSQWQSFRSGGHSPDDPWVDAGGQERSGTTWRHVLPGDTKIDNIGLTVRLNGDQVQLDYTFPSLISALRIMLALNVSSASEQIRRCALQECGLPFLPKSDRGRYCSDSHSNLDRQRLFLQDNPDYYKKRKRESRKGASNGTTKTKT